MSPRRQRILAGRTAYTPRQVSRLAGINPETGRRHLSVRDVRSLIRTRDLHAEHIGTGPVVHREDLDRFLSGYGLLPEPGLDLDEYLTSMRAALTDGTDVEDAAREVA